LKINPRQEKSRALNHFISRQEELINCQKNSSAMREIRIELLQK
jgi:hypothetical protein